MKEKVEGSFENGRGKVKRFSINPDNEEEEEAEKEEQVNIADKYYNLKNNCFSCILHFILILIK